MAGIYQAEIFCDTCVDCIKENEYNVRSDSMLLLTLEEWEEAVGYDDETNYDSDSYPKYCSGDDESDCPQHCGGCGEFMENSLTSYGADYVVEAVNEDLRAGRTDSVAVTVWMPYYDYLDYAQQCESCGCWSPDGETFNGGDCADCDTPPERDTLAIVHDCYDYFIRGIIGKDYSGLNDLFYQKYGRSGCQDGYYCEVSDLCLRYENWLAYPPYWDSNSQQDFADEFNRIVPNGDPNY